MTAPFHLYLWPHRLLVISPSHASSQHRHHAAQIACGLEGPVAYNSQGGVHTSDLMLIPPDAPHSHAAFGPAAVLYLDADSAEWAHFPHKAAAGVAPLPFSTQLRATARQAAAGNVDAAHAFVTEVLG